jgi:integrase
LKTDAISALIAASSGQERVLYILLAASGLRISEALALEAKHFVNGGRTILVEQQVEKDCPRIVPYLKSDSARREVDLSVAVAEFLQRYVSNESGLVLHTRRGTPHLYHNIETRWLNPRLAKMKLDTEGMGWHSFRRFRNTWLRLQRAQQDVLQYWMGHRPETMTELYSHLSEDLQMRLDEAERVGHGFHLPKQPEVVPIVPKKLRIKAVAGSGLNVLELNELIETVGV